MLTVIAPPRGTDAYGSGRFGAKRGSRLHLGIDDAIWPGSLVCSMTSGVVTRLGWPYSEPERKKLRLIEIKNDIDGALVRYLYLSPHVVEGQRVERDQVLGSVQDLREFYKNGMTPHCHVDVNINGTFVDPEIYFKSLYSKV